MQKYEDLEYNIICAIGGKIHSISVSRRILSGRVKLTYIQIVDEEHGVSKTQKE